MNIKKIALLSCAVALFPVSAQAQTDNKADHFDGPYVGGFIGYNFQGQDGNETLLFDTNLDGSFDDTVNTPTNPNAFSPGFCGGANGGTANVGCQNDFDGIAYGGRLGFDKRMGNFVLGAVIEGSNDKTRDRVSGFSTTPARYTFSREADVRANARLRLGYTPGGGALFYVTGGGAYARMDNRFTTTNTVNSFDRLNGNVNQRTNAYGYAAGGGAEVMVTNNVSLGLEYLYTDLKDDDYVVNFGAKADGTTPAGNAFILDNAEGTDVKRSGENFRTHGVRASLNFRF